MYYPKSQVKTNLYTNGGEFFRTDNQLEYKGYYWQNSKDQFFSGKTPNQAPTVLIVRKSQEDSETTSVPKKYSTWIGTLPSGESRTKPGLSPNKNEPIPTEDDYSVGDFTRYFTKKTNQNIYYEISKEDYAKLENKDSSIKWQLYQGIQLKWLLIGGKDGVYKANKNTVMIAEQQQRLPGFSKIFRKDYLQYYKI